MAQGKFPDYEDICREILLVEYPEEVPHAPAEDFAELSWNDILDDVFAYYDEERMLQTLKWLKAHKKQVLLFTCQKREEQVMKEAGSAYHKIEL